MPDLSFILDVLTLIAIVTGVYFGIAELRRSRRERKVDSVITVLTSVIRPDEIHIQNIIYDLPIDAPAEMINSNPEILAAAQKTSNQFDILGFFVFDRLIDLRTFDFMFGGAVRQSWLRLHNHIEAIREESGTESVGEWFQWLAERLEEHPQAERAKGAHIAYRDWKP